jgi:2-keto-4-pentenoate hydratase/2-oxohepta-3-ene-1,7-dioic acid hydratase in catechol pathway
VIGIGDNYAGLGKLRVDKTATRPVFFLKPPTTSVVGPGPVAYPADVGKLDWEIELAVVIGRTARRIDPAAAAGAIAGYTIGIDLSARDWQFDPRSPVTPDVFGGKAFDGSCPLGPWIVPSALLPDPQALTLTLAVNGIVRQSGTTGSMIWSVCEQIALISNILTLEPGDVILTGTPAGTSIASGSFLSPGDQIDASIEGIGTLSLTIGP